MGQKTLIKSKEGVRIYLYRAWTKNENLAADEYLPESEFQIGIMEEPLTPDTQSLTIPLPLANGVVNDNGTNTLTGSDGGSNSTSNTDIFMPDAAGQTDDTAQNLTSNVTDVNKKWHISNLDTNVADDKYCGFYLYLDALVLDFFESIKVSIGDNSSNYYYKFLEIEKLKAGWNWIYLGIVNELNNEGSPSASLQFFESNIIVKSLANHWSSGHVVYDLLRSYDLADTKKEYVIDYPQINLNTLEATKKSIIDFNEANGFLINAYADWNEDDVPKIGTAALMDKQSKTSSEKFFITIKERLRR